jgi:CubicO group peptidase (beta-lactamase class C family)
VAQQGVDVKIRLLNSSGRTLKNEAGPVAGLQVLSALTDRPGIHTLQISPVEKEAISGKYSIKLERLEPLSVTPEGRIDQIMAAYDRPGVPGAAVGVVQRGQLIISKGYGTANLEHGIPFTPETVSDIGSVSKQFTAFALVLLDQRGKLSLDDDIRIHLPSVPDFGHVITVRQLIHHTSGLREIYNSLQLAGWRSGDGIRQEDAMRLVRGLRELNFEPGSQHLYCNTGYMLLADIVAAASGTPFETWMRANVFGPLGMNHTYIMDEQGETFPKCAESYQQSDSGGFKKVFDNSSIQGAGGIYTTIGDLAKWLSNFRDPNVGGRSALDKMQERGVLRNGKKLDYAFGLRLKSGAGTRIIQHGGSSAGYRAALAWFPEHDLGIVVKSNRADFDSTVVDLMAGIYIKPFLKVTPRPRERRRPRQKIEIALPAEKLAAYSGRYFSYELETLYTLVVEEGRLICKHRRHDDFPLAPVGKDEFRGPQFFAEVRFERDDTGNISGLRVSNGRVLDLRFDRIN